MVITDDNFASIVAAVEEGRVVFDNIKKSVRFMLSCNIGEVFTVLTATLMGFPLILMPLQILWMNLVTDSLPALALGVDPREPDVMRRQPRNPREPMLSRRGLARMASTGLFMTACTLASFAYVVYTSPAKGEELLTLARTATFCTIVFFQLFFAFSARSERHTLLELGWASNKWLWGAFLAGATLQLIAVYGGPLHAVFQTSSLPLDLFAASVVLALLGFLGAEFTKIAHRRLGHKQTI